MIITGNNEVAISMLTNDLSVRFEMKNLGEVNCFLGLEIEKTDQGYFVSQKTCEETVAAFWYGESKEKATPMEPHLKLMKAEGKPLKDAKEFQQLVGSLIYLTITRPQIAYSVGIVSQFMHCPRSSHLNAARQIFRYVKGLLDYGFMYKRHEKFMLDGFTDADWAGDTNDRHSISGYCFSTGLAMVSWCSKKQPVVTLSSTEAEYVAATMAAQECMWLKRLIGEMLCKVDYAVQIRCDNESAIKLASNPIFDGRTKHIEVCHHYIREKVLEQEVVSKGISTNEQVADIFTKSLIKPKFEYFRATLGIVDHKHALRGSVKN